MDVDHAPLNLSERLALIELEIGDLAAREERRQARIDAMQQQIEAFHQWRIELERVLLSAA